MSKLILDKRNEMKGQKDLQSHDCAGNALAFLRDDKVRAEHGGWQMLKI